MNQLLQVQRAFSIHIAGANGYQGDLSEVVADGVSYEEQADLTRVLNFTIDKHAETIIESLAIGQTVTLTAGTFYKMRKIFVGSIRKITLQLPEEGAVRANIECLSTSWTKLGKETSMTSVYPDFRSTRNFANAKTELKISEIVKGIVAENDMSMGAEPDIPETTKDGKGGDRLFKLTDALHQNKTSDWNLLRRLANKCGCVVWTEFIDDTEKVFFIDKSKVQKTPDKYFKDNKPVSFLYPLRTSGRVNDFRNKRLADGQIIIKEATLTVDVAVADSISYNATKFDFDTGEELNAPMAVIRQENGHKVMVFYELDEEKIRKLEEDNPRLAKTLRDMGPLNIPWEGSNGRPGAKDFYKETTKVEDGENYVFDGGAFFGITVDVTIPGDVDIRSQRSYEVFGIPRYGTKSIKERFWAYSLKHRWESDGFWTDIQFKK